MKSFTLIIGFLMIFSVMAKSQSVVSELETLKLSPVQVSEFIDLDFVWCDFEGEYTNTGGFRETVSGNTVAKDVYDTGADENAFIELVYNVNADAPTTGYQMWSYPDMIDVSKYKNFVFMVKADRVIENAHVILLDDVTKHAEGNSQHPFSIGTEWQQVFLPLDSFKVQTGFEIPADLTILHLIQILFINDVTSEIEGTVYIDDVGFTSNVVNVSKLKVDEKSVNIYPNPAASYVDVSAEAGSQISLINISGSIIASKIADAAITRFSLSDVPQGIYFVRVSNNNKNITRKLLTY